MSIVDAHTHLLGEDVDPATLQQADRLGVSTLLCSNIAGYRHYPSLEDVVGANAVLADVARRRPELVRAYCYVNPRHGRAAEDDFARCVEDRGMIGLKLWVATTCDDPLVFPFVEKAVDYRIPVLVHAFDKATGQLPYESTAVNVARLAERYPSALIVMAHLGGRVENAVNAVAHCPNVHTDTSGTPIGGGEVAIAVRRLGAHRVVFGSDLPGACLAANVGKVLGAGLTGQEQELVLGGNIRRLLAERR